jgi:phosphoribosylglycinamide formyltransferase-1
MTATNTTVPIAIFLSGGGRSLQNLIDHQQQGMLPGVALQLALSSSSKVRGVKVASDAGIETSVVLKSAYPDPDAYTEAMFGPCRTKGIELVVMAGFLKHVRIPPDYAGRVINIHPSLLPSFGGEGMYGHRVHQAALDRGVQFSGCTVHYVDNDYDNGPIILQRCCLVANDDTADSLASRVFQLECEALPTALLEAVSAVRQHSQRNPPS